MSSILLEEVSFTDLHQPFGFHLWVDHPPHLINEAIDGANIELLLDVDIHYLSRYPFFHFQ